MTDIALLKHLTLELDEKVTRAKQIFRERNQQTYDFYRDVKPFVDESKEIADRWRKMALLWVQSDRPKYIYTKQIEQTYDNVLIVAVQAFQKDTKEKRFIEMVKSIHFILDTIPK